MQQLVTTLTTISVTIGFLLRVSEKLLFKVYEAVPLSQFHLFSKDFLTLKDSQAT